MRRGCAEEVWNFLRRVAAGVNNSAVEGKRTLGLVPERALSAHYSLPRKDPGATAPLGLWNRKSALCPLFSWGPASAEMCGAEIHYVNE